MGLLDRLLGNNSARQVKLLRKDVDAINALEPSMQALSDAGLRAKTEEFKKRLANGETVDDLMCEAFAVVREAAVRTVGMRHYDVQLVGGIVLHQGRIAEMKTGEGKTLVATLPSYLNALADKGVHIVTVNDYLAKRDSEWMGKIHRFLGLSVGVVVHDLNNDQRREAYNCDITYGTNNELGFDYLRDNMVVYKSEMVQRKLCYAIVDEVDSILVDEARTPLIISGRGTESTDLYEQADRLVIRLKRDADFEVDEKRNTVMLTDDGVKKAEEFFAVDNFGDIENTELNHHVKQALKARNLMRRDKDYVVQDGQVIIVDEFTGRLMTGRRYNEGLHQAIEAKEGVKVRREDRTLATITFQNYFRMYEKLAGMTGTAKTEEEEFQSIYNLDVVEIPTNMPMIRKDENDVIYGTEKGKFSAVIEEIVKRHATGQPILVGTVSVEKSEVLSKLLSRRGVSHHVLNAKHHQKEAMIVAQAGKLGAVTIATNMAGRGTDILLGGNPDFMARTEMARQGFEDALIEEATGHADTQDEDILLARRTYAELYSRYKQETDAEHDRVVEAGGLCILGTERHESRRIDNQLRGRSGRQGDPGVSKFYIALQDDLMRLFGGERIQGILSRLSDDDSVAIEYGMLSKQIENAQKRVESRNFEIRKNVLKYDDVMNKQRELIYAQRRSVLEEEDMHSTIMDMMDACTQRMLDDFLPAALKPNEWDIDGLANFLAKHYGEDEKAAKAALTGREREKTGASLQDMMRAKYAAKERQIQGQGWEMRDVERVILLRVVDDKWMDHIDAMDQLRQGIGLRAYGHTDPIIAYTNEGFEMFENMIASIQEDTVDMLLRVSVKQRPERKRVSAETSNSSTERKAALRTGAKIGRNAPCPCGSGKKYKNCCANKTTA
ncbi:MAG: preprotein translocase subunit SecA [Christensenellales bacterium]|jgi:preprotein translocase subunit SecA